MKRYEIENTESGLVLGVYEGEDEADALRAMFDDAGAGPDVEPDPALAAREVDVEVHAWNGEEYGFMAGDSPTAADIDGYFTVENFRRMFGGTSPSSEAFEQLRSDAHAALFSADESREE